MRFLLGLLLVLGAGAAGLVALGQGDPAKPVREARDVARRVETTAKEAKRVVKPAAASVPHATCPDDASDCRSVTGRVVYVERVDPDGDGDLHVVLIGNSSVTGPGLTSVDVRKGLRPERDPQVGDRASAAGPVQRGSHGQDQIHALEFHVRSS